MKPFDREDAPSTPKLFMLGLVLLALTFFPVIGFLFGALGVLIFLFLPFQDPWGFLGMVWRLILVLAMLFCIWYIACTYDRPYDHPVWAIIGLTLSACSLARSFYLGHIRKNG
jgi:hypothetical protein